MRTDVEKTNAAPDTAEDMGGAVVFICQHRSITLTYIDNDIVCVRDQRYDTGWGAHGSTTVTGCAYSLETGDPVGPDIRLWASRPNRRNRLLPMRLPRISPPIRAIF